MLRLILNGHLMDLYENESVNLTLQFADIQNINSSAGSFSQTFRLPATPNNLDFFGPIDESTSVDGLNLKQRIPAELVSGTVPILSGFCQVKSIYLQKEKYADIEVVFFSGSVDLRTELGGKMLTELDLSAFNHVLNISNIQNSWLGSLFSGDVRYGLIDKGFNWSFPDNLPWDSSDGIWQGELTPYLRAKNILDAVMDDAGFTYDSSFLEATGTGNFSEIYMPLYNGLPTPAATTAVTPYARVGLAADYTGTTLAKLNLSDTATGAQDQGDNYAPSTDTYTVPYTGIYQLSLVYSYSYPAAGSALIYIHKNGASFVQVDTALPIRQAYNRYFITTAYLTAGDTIDVRGIVSGTGAVIYGNNNTVAGVRTALSITASDQLSGQTIDVAANLPEMKQIDFVLGLQKMFNLVFVPDKNKPNHLLIEPFTDYTSTGTAKDWTGKVDYDKDVSLIPTTDIQFARYDWTYLPGLDFVSDAIQKSLDRVYGAYRVLDPGNDFATGENTVQTTFGQYLTSVIPGSSFPIHRSLKADGTAIDKPLPMLAYYHGLSAEYGSWYGRDDSGATVGPSTLFPSFSNYSSDTPTVSDRDLNYGVEEPFFTVQATPANTLYFEYWAQYVAELYSEEARIMKCTMRLSRADLASFEFSDRIFIKDSYWRVLKLSYDANIEGVCSVELIKELSDIAICEDTPTGYFDRYNAILFNGSNYKSPDYGSQTCCELYGYYWTGNIVLGGVGYSGICVPKSQSTQPE